MDTASTFAATALRDLLKLSDIYTHCCSLQHILQWRVSIVNHENKQWKWSISIQTQDFCWFLPKLFFLWLLFFFLFLFLFYLLLLLFFWRWHTTPPPTWFCLKGEGIFLQLSTLTCLKRNLQPDPVGCIESAVNPPVCNFGCIPASKE